MSVCISSRVMYLRVLAGHFFCLREPMVKIMERAVSRMLGAVCGLAGFEYTDFACIHHEKSRTDAVAG